MNRMGRVTRCFQGVVHDRTIMQLGSKNGTKTYPAAGRRHDPLGLTRMQQIRAGTPSIETRQGHVNQDTKTPIC